MTGFWPGAHLRVVGNQPLVQVPACDRLKDDRTCFVDRFHADVLLGQIHLHSSKKVIEVFPQLPGNVPSQCQPEQELCRRCDGLRDPHGK